MKFIEYQNDRVRTNEISSSTVPNYCKAAIDENKTLTEVIQEALMEYLQQKPKKVE